MMKKNRWYLVCGLIACASAMQAQTEYDITPIMTPELNGTARFVGMGGAMSALGADISTMGTNPAGIGLYRSNDFAVTVSSNSVDSKTNTYGNVGTAERWRLSFDQIGFVYSTKIGNNTSLRYVNFGFNYHKYANFNKRMMAEGNLGGNSQTGYMAWQAANSDISYDDFADMISLPANQEYKAYDNENFGWLTVMGGLTGLVDADEENGSTSFYGWDGGYTRSFNRTTGGVSAYDFNMAINVEDRCFLGITMGVYDVNYSRYTCYEESGLSRSGLGASYSLENWYKADGNGFDVKLGAIVRPLEDSSWKVGLSIHTPTWYNLTESYSSYLASNYDVLGEDGSVENYNADTDSYYAWGGNVVNDYELKTPWRFNISTGYTFGRSVALDAEYEVANYKSARLRDGLGYEDNWAWTQNGYIKEDLKAVSTLRLGMEAKLLPEVSFRMGYNYTSPMYKTTAYKDLPVNTTRTDTQFANDKGSNTVTVGLGYKKNNFYVDMAYLYRQNKADYYAFDDASLKATSVKDEYSRFLLTAGVKF